jgi:alkylhydroperoxidase family enzyme
MAWLGTVSRQDADGRLAEVYEAMASRPTPDVYQPPRDAPAIIRAHSLDPELLSRTFQVSGGLHQSALDWADRELISSVTSRTNQCFY